MIGIKYSGPLMDSSGYGSAARQYVYSIQTVKDIDLTLHYETFETEKTNHGERHAKIKELLEKNIPYKYHIIHMTPDLFSRLKENNKYNIGYAAWETDRLPRNWADYCNQMNEIWVPSDYNVGCFKRSGVTVPVIKIPHAIEIDKDNQINTKLEITSDNSFIFYSIGQWIERKNMLGLLKAYLTEFDSDEKVCLVIKSYRLNTSIKEQEIIKEQVKALKATLRLNQYPPIKFFGQLFTRDEIKALHNACDVYVAPVRSEGWGIPIAEAMTYEKPVIATNYSGQIEFAKPEHSYLIDCQETPCAGMIFGDYNGKMSWAEPDLMHLKKLMRHTFNNRKEAKEKGKKAKKYIEKNYNHNTIGKLIFDRLMEIEKETKHG